MSREVIYFTLRWDEDGFYVQMHVQGSQISNIGGMDKDSPLTAFLVALSWTLEIEELLS